MTWHSPFQAADAQSNSLRPKRFPAADHARGDRDFLCAGHDDQHPRRRGLEGARGQGQRAGARRHRHSESCAFARRARRAHHSIGRYRHERHGRRAQIPHPGAGALQQISGRDRSRAAAAARDRRARYRWRMAVFVVAGNPEPQQRRPALLRLSPRQRRTEAAHQRAVPLAPHRAGDDPALEAHQPGRTAVLPGC